MNSVAESIMHQQQQKQCAKSTHSDNKDHHGEQRKSGGREGERAADPNENESIANAAVQGASRFDDQTANMLGAVYTHRQTHCLYVTAAH